MNEVCRLCGSPYYTCVCTDETFNNILEQKEMELQLMASAEDYVDFITDNDKQCEALVKSVNQLLISLLEACLPIPNKITFPYKFERLFKSFRHHQIKYEMNELSGTILRVNGIKVEFKDE